MAGSGINPPDSEFLSAEIRALLAASGEARPNLSFCDFLTGNELFKMLVGVHMVRYVVALHHPFWPGRSGSKTVAELSRPTATGAPQKLARMAS